MQQTVYLYAITMFKQYFSLLYFLIFAACSVTQNNIQNEPGNSTQSSHITISKADPNTAYLGKWQLLKLDGAPFVATPVLQRKQPNNPAAMSPVAASASIQFNSIQPRWSLPCHSRVQPIVWPPRAGVSRFQTWPHRIHQNGMHHVSRTGIYQRFSDNDQSTTRR